MKFKLRPFVYWFTWIFIVCTYSVIFLLSILISSYTIICNPELLYLITPNAKSTVVLLQWFLWTVHNNMIVTWFRIDTHITSCYNHCIAQFDSCFFSWSSQIMVINVDPFIPVPCYDCYMRIFLQRLHHLSLLNLLWRLADMLFDGTHYEQDSNFMTEFDNFI